LNRLGAAFSRSKLGAHLGMPNMSWSLRIASGRRRADAVPLKQQVKFSPAPVGVRQAGGRLSTGVRPAVRAIGAIVILAVGFALGASSAPLAQSAAYRLVAPGSAGPSLDAEAAYAAYDKGDHARALRLAQPLAEQGDARAQSLVGLIYYIGRGALRDDAKAVTWLRLAADQGDAAAQFRLGLVYSEGQGVPQDHAEAAKWYRLAADQRHPQAQYNLGLLYATGEGVEQDHVRAHMWFNLAVAQFPASDARYRTAAVNRRDVMANKLTREQVAEAQKLAREWQPTPHGQLGSGTSFANLPSVQR
jgi:TPR repeat protein